MEDVALMKCQSYDKDLKENIIKLVDGIGGFGKYFRRGDKVLIKPNFVLVKSLNPVNSAVTTNPEFISSVAEVLLDMGCTVAVGDSPMIGDAVDIAKRIGIYDRLSRLGVKFINFRDTVPVSSMKEVLKNRRFKELTISKEVSEYDKIVNLPKLKTHSQMGMTLATKNLFGCVVGKRKLGWHMASGDMSTFARLLVEIALTVKPTLSILDGIVGMDLDGPTNGRPRRTGVILASTNTVALDRIVIELIGKKASTFPIFKAAEDLFAPGSDISDINVIGEKIENCRIKNFRLLRIYPVDFIGLHFIYGPFKGLLKQRMVIDESKCIKCRRCEMQCPAEAMHFDGRIIIDHKKCIRCCCCSESCHQGAVKIDSPLLLKIFNR
jgi:uncharacterized protein (DUF362 family)